ncbi:MerR family transcriptional regulator [Solwaraspora sp. WMMD791]|uniref:MerR family transcriptional regulator n=1 Tax=Solwaraspora sp. WMMD791 TaxID=3016086 RepID=UPI00249C0D6E|nr:MerR family transcriptional regulator [Solwaraspora sp. WMMD791]WFE25569.1 MerR family transcriptional regulator [Solwaraspora sp. WMMD791]
MSDDALSAGSVARRLGVAVTTLRTWHQRYGLGPTRHVKGHHRRYSADDLARLEVMRRLTAQGVAPAEAARWARRVGSTLDPDGVAGTEPVPFDVIDPGRAGGGFTIGVPGAGPAARGLARAAVRLDNQAMRDILERALHTDGVIATWDRVVRPVLAGVGDRYAATAGFVEVEHLLSRCVSEAFAMVNRPRPRVAGRHSHHPAGPGALLACADEEQHTLPLEALSAALAEAGVTSRLLGARVPPAALAAAIDRTGPSAVVLWSHTSATADPDQLLTARSGRHRPLLVLAVGPGWSVPDLPAGVDHCAGLADAVTRCRTADEAASHRYGEPTVD